MTRKSTRPRQAEGGTLAKIPGGRASITDQDALLFHSRGRPGKLEVVATKPMATQRDLSLAYSPGVAVPVKAIAADPSTAYDYTSRGNMVAVITNGTAILGLGNLGALASKPVMEGKAVLFKRFADVDSIDLEVDTEDPEEFINAVKFLGPSFGGINLEDIKAPECFIIEERLRELMDIPVFHDDQHGTAIIAAAGMINAMRLTGRDIKKTRLVCNGAGAAGIACLDLIKAIGFAPENVILCDTKGVVYRGRAEGMNQWKSAHAVDTEARTLADAMAGADIFFGLSAKGALTPEMVKSMAPNPDHLRDGQSRSRDHAGRGARGARRRHHGDRALGLSQPGQQRAGLPLHLPRRPGRARQDDQHGDEDRRRQRAGGTGARGRAGRGRGRLSRRAAALRARIHHPDAVRSPPHPRHPDGGGQGGDGVRRRAPADRRHERLQGAALGAPRPHRRRHAARPRARCGGCRSASCSPRARRSRSSAPPIPSSRKGLGSAILVGREDRVRAAAQASGLDLAEKGIEIHNARLSQRNAVYAQFLYERLQRRGYLLRDCQRLINQDRNTFAAAMVARGEADAMVTGVTRNFSVALEEVRRVIDDKPGHRVIGVSLVLARGRPIVVADTAITEMPDAEDLAQIAIEAAGVARRLGYEPRVALLAFSSFGHPPGERTMRVQEAVRLLDAQARRFRI